MKGIKGRAMLDSTQEFKVGDPMPDGYIARQEWAEVHLAAGLKQKECGYCGRWCFPQELSPKEHVASGWKLSRGKMPEKRVIRYQICLKCAKD